MALDVSRFPETVNIPRNILYSDFVNSGMRERDGEREGLMPAKKRKRTFPNFFAGKSSSRPKENEHSGPEQYNYVRVKSFHPQANLAPSPLIQQVSTIETSTVDGLHKRSKPRLPQLAIPHAPPGSIRASRLQVEFVNPPTPKVEDASTKATIKALGLTKSAPRLQPPNGTVNPAIFGDGIPTFSAISPPSSSSLSPYSGLSSDRMGSDRSAGPKSTSTSSPGSARPLPPIPGSHHPSPSSSMKPITNSAPFSTLNTNSSSSVELATPQDGASSSARPAIKAPPGLLNRGRRALPPVPLVIVKPYFHKSVPVASPPPSYESDKHCSQVSNVITDNVAARSANCTPAPPDVIVFLPSPADFDEDTDDQIVLRPATESKDGISAIATSSSDPFIATNILSGSSQPRNITPEINDSPRDVTPAPVLPSLTPSPRRNGPPRATDQPAWAWLPPDCWSGPSSPHVSLPAPRGRIQEDRRSGSAKGVEKKHGSAKPREQRSRSAKGIENLRLGVEERRRPVSAKGLFLRGKSLSRMTSEEREVEGKSEPSGRTRPKLKLDTQRSKTPDPWEEEDRERSAVDTQLSKVWGNEDIQLMGGDPMLLKPGLESEVRPSLSRMGSGYSTLITAVAPDTGLRFDGEKAHKDVTAIGSAKDIYTVISQLRVLKAPTRSKK